jgi:hypothetical protein
MKVISFLAKCLALILVILLLLAIPAAVFAWDLGRVVFNPPLVNKLITQEVLQSDLIPNALEWYSDSTAQARVESGEAQTGISEPNIVQLMSRIDTPAWKQIMAEVLPDEILSGWVSVTVDGSYAWIDSSERVPQITWDMQPFIERVNSEHGLNSIEIVYALLSACSPEEIADFETRLAAAPDGTEVLYNLCAFPEPWHEDQFNDYVNSLHEVVKKIPPQFALTDELSRVSDAGGVGPQALKQQLVLIRFVMNWLWLVPVLLLLVILGLAVRSRKGLGRWWGIPLLVSSVIIVLPALIYRRIITDVLARGPLSETPELIKAEALRVILRLAGYVFQPLLWQAAVVLLVGLVLVVLLPLEKKKVNGNQLPT